MDREENKVTAGMRGNDNRNKLESVSRSLLLEVTDRQKKVKILVEVS